MFPAEDDLQWLRERICKVANVSLSQLEPTKISTYERGQYFAKHTDASFLHEKLWAFSARLAGVDDEGVQDPCTWPSRFMTLFLYLNDVGEGGRTNFHWLDGSDSIPGAGIFTQCIAELSSADERQGGQPCGSAQNGHALSFVPRAGTAVIHFPTTTLEHGCVPDPRTMHESETAIDTKHIVQQFIWPVPIQKHQIDDDIDGSPSAADGDAGGGAHCTQHEDVRREWEALFRLAGGDR